ncbi:unnamed protein product [Phytomonas sp. EM1]|nr:unnamed protein product [Phytomonas sp. EM1]|eukprot:CCW60100.1 unnamed protein product [Phytomonas sp. isolate EM1]
MIGGQTSSKIQGPLPTSATSVLAKGGCVPSSFSINPNEEVSPVSPQTSVSSTSQAVCPPVEEATREIPQRDEGSYPHCPIYIPSKGRYDQTRTTMSTLMRDLVPFTLVVEPDEVESYTRMLDCLVMEFLNSYETTRALAAVDGGAEQSHGDTIAAGDQAPDSGLVPAPPLLHSQSISKHNISEESDTKPLSLLLPSPQRCACCNVLTLAEERAWPFARRIAELYHHGYLFRPHVGDGKRENNSSVDPAAASIPQRVASAAFTLTDVDAVRRIFKVVALPEGGHGVSYVRNYILHVLVPQQMVGCGVDRTGNIEELGLFSSPTAPTLSAALPTQSHPASDASRIFLPNSTLKSFELDPSVYEAVDLLQGANGSASPLLAQASESAQSPSSTPFAPPHGLYGYYWVMDDDISTFSHADAPNRRNKRISARQMMRNVEARILHLNQNASNPNLLPISSKENGIAPSSYVRKANPKIPIFTCKEDVLASNWKPVHRTRMANQTASSSSGVGDSKGVTSSTNINNSNHNASTINADGRSDGTDGDVKPKSTVLNINNYPYVASTACFSLEYSRFSFTYDNTALAVNSYNNIACLFNYRLLHNPTQTLFFPPHATGGVRSAEETLMGIPINASPEEEEEPHVSSKAVANGGHPSYRYYMPGSMLWYRFVVREDYDFTLQLIARGMYTLRFRDLSFEVPQMGKVRGGMTTYYRTCGEDIKRQNRLFVAQWPAVAQAWPKGRKETARDDIRVRWDLLHPSRSRHPGAFLFLKDPLPQLQQTAPPPPPPPCNVIEELPPVKEVISHLDRGNNGNEKDEDTLLKSSGVKRGRPASSSSFSSSSSSSLSSSGSETEEGSRASSARREVPAVAVKPVDSLPQPSLPPSSPPLPPPPQPTSSPPLPPPPAPAPSAATQNVLRVDHSSRWKGYAVERWRNLDPTEAAALGLRLLPPESLHIGQTVAIVPPLLSQQPSVVLATLIEKQPNVDGEGDPRWTAVVQRVREIPVLTVSHCYAIPDQGLQRAAAAVDAFFAKLWANVAPVASSSSKFLDD